MFDKRIHDNGGCAADSSGSEGWQGGWQHPGGRATGRKPKTAVCCPSMPQRLQRMAAKAP